MQEKIMGILRKMINGGRPPKETMLIIFLSGILIFVILLPTGKENSSYQNRKNQDSKSSAASGSASDTEYATAAGAEEAGIDEYRKGLERELEDFLSSVAGVGEVKVLIYMKNSQEYIVEKNTPTTSSVNGDSSDLTRDETTVYTVNGNGDEVPFVSQTKSPEIDGVVVAAKGASNETVRVQIVRLVMALYGVEANKVEVFAMG